MEKESQESILKRMQQLRIQEFAQQQDIEFKQFVFLNKYTQENIQKLISLYIQDQSSCKTDEEKAQ